MTGIPVRPATRNVYVACSRSREDVEAFVESMADLLQIQNRTGDRKAAAEMAFEPDQNDRRAELKQPLNRFSGSEASKPSRPSASAW